MSKIFEYPNSVGTWRFNNSPTTTNCYEDEVEDKLLFCAGNWEKVSDEVTRPRLTIENQIHRDLKDKFRNTILEQREQIQNNLMCILDGLDNEDQIVDSVCSVIVERFQIILNELENQNA